jgi:hypothetical protein
MNKTHDWVVIYYDNGSREGQATTAYKGALEGKRIIRGREEECEAYYEKLKEDVKETLECATRH